MTYVIYQVGNSIRGTSYINYSRYAMNEREINYFTDFDTIEEVKEYIKKYFYDVDKIIVV